MNQRYALMIALGGLAGCAKTESADLLTSGIYAAISATATGDGNTTVSATLYVDDPNNLNFVELTGDDHLTASSGSTQMPLTQSELGNIVSHTAVFAGDAEGTQYTVAFARTVDAGAPSTTVALPPAFTVAPVAATVSRQARLDITYGPAGTSDKIAYALEGVCINPLNGSVSDTGALTIPPNTIVAPDVGSANASPLTCKVTLTLSREHVGSLDPHYGKGGQALGQQQRVVSWTTTP